jgi:hypothetical protein
VKIQVSHGGDPENPAWFVVLPLPGTTRPSVAGTPITNEMAVASLVRAGRSVYELDVEPFLNKGAEPGTIRVLS